MAKGSSSSRSRRKIRYAVVGMGYIAQAAVLPAFRHDVENPQSRSEWEQLWGAPIAHKRGWHLSRMFEEMEHGNLRSLYVIGENPAQSEADSTRALRLLDHLDHVVVQDMTSAASRHLAISAGRRSIMPL